MQKLIETVTTKEQISLVKSALKPGFLSLVRDVNGNRVLHSCLQCLGPNDNKVSFSQHNIHHFMFLKMFLKSW